MSWQFDGLEGLSGSINDGSNGINSNGNEVFSVNKYLHNIKTRNVGDVLRAV